MPAGPEFPDLSAEERQTIEAWRAAAEKRGLDAVIDLTGRRWNIPAARVIIGIFRSGEATASWLLVRNESTWMTIDCRSETVAGESLSLSECLTKFIA